MSMHAMSDISRALRGLPASAEGHSSFSVELERLLFKGLRVADSKEVRALFEHELFRPREGLTREQVTALGYQRARFLARALKLGAAELRDDPRRLYALHDWAPLACGVTSAIVSTHCCLALGSLVVHGEGRPELDGFIGEQRRSFPGAMDPVQTGRVCFTGMGAAMMRAATWTSFSVASQQVPAAAGERKVSSLSYQNVQRDVFGGLATAYAVTFAARFLQTRFRARTAEAEPELFRLTAALEAVVTADVSEALLRLGERTGATGTPPANRILDYWNQLQRFATADGANQLTLLRAGRQLLDVPNSSLPVVPRAAVSAALDPQEAVFLFGYREAWLKQELRERTSDARRRTDDPLTIWNDNINRTIALAKAHGTRLLAECFRVAIADCGDDAGARVLRKLFSLWALGQVDRHADWLLSQGCITREAAFYLQSDGDRLCAGIEPHVPELVGAFGIDDTLICAPSVQDDYFRGGDSSFGPIAPDRKSGAFPIEIREDVELREACGVPPLAY